jgi:hypothetical protein
MDELIEHARFHAEEHGDDFFVFLSKHYGELKSEHSKKHQEEQKEHEELPFQHQIHTAALSAFVIGESILSTVNPDFKVQNKSNFFYQDSSSSYIQEGPFQPPQQA